MKNNTFSKEQMRKIEEAAETLRIASDDFIRMAALNAAREIEKNRHYTIRLLGGHSLHEVVEVEVPAKLIEAARPMAKRFAIPINDFLRLHAVQGALSGIEGAADDSDLTAQWLPGSRN